LASATRRTTPTIRFRKLLHVEQRTIILEISFHNFGGLHISRTTLPITSSALLGVASRQLPATTRWARGRQHLHLNSQQTTPEEEQQRNSNSNQKTKGSNQQSFFFSFVIIFFCVRPSISSSGLVSIPGMFDE